MARRFALEGAKVLLAAKMSKPFKDNSHESIKVTGEDIMDDDIHLILEYKRNEIWSDLQTPRANRFIIHSDRNNPTVSSLEGFEAPLEEFKPDLLVVSGLQMMDNYPFAQGERQARLKKVGCFTLESDNFVIHVLVKSSSCISKLPFPPSSMSVVSLCSSV